MKKFILFILMVTLTSFVFGEFDSITSPMPSVLSRGDYSFGTKFYGDSSMRLNSNIGLFDRLTIGFSYAAENFVGNKETDWNDHIDFKAKFQILKETVNIPAWSIGFDSEGHGKWLEGLKRYAVKSPGFYTTIGKNDLFLRGSKIVLGINRSAETEDGDKDLNTFITLGQSIGDDLSFLLEYNFAFNDNDNSSNELEAFGDGKGYLNLSAGWYIIPELQFKFTVYDILENAPNFTANEDITLDRSFQIIYTTKF